MVHRRHILKGGIGGGLSASITLIAPHALAHKQKLTLTDIHWNAKTDTLDIIHSFHIHETETALSQAGLIAYPDLSRLKARAQLALYTEKNFSLRHIDGSELKLELIGAENEGRSVFVYQQIGLKIPPPGLIVDCRLFRDLVSEQINNVDVRFAHTLKSLQFRGNDGPKKVLA